MKDQPTDATAKTPDATDGESMDSPTVTHLRVPNFGAQYVEHARRQLFARHPEYLPNLLRRLDLQPGMTVVEVGCGSGAYTRLFASQLSGRGAVIGVDVNAQALTEAQERAELEGWGEIAHFVAGSPEKLPLPDACADRVFCSSLLWRAGDPVTALREMRRVLRPGGKALAAEPDGGLVQCYLPDQPRLAELEQRFQQCYARGVRSVDGHDYDIGRRLPALFLAADFVAVRAFPRLFVAAGCDLGENPQEGLAARLAEYQQGLAAMQSDTLEARAGRERRASRAKAGGMSEDELQEYERETLAYLRERVEHPERIASDGSLYTYGGLFCEGLRFEES